MTGPLRCAHAVTLIPLNRGTLSEETCRRSILESSEQDGAGHSRGNVRGEPYVSELHIAEIKEGRLKEVADKTKPATATTDYASS